MTLYKPEIDTLRAISVMAVIFFHFELFSLTGGYLGVDIFFVISGYLISLIIFNEISEERFSFLNFYIRRIKRIFPMLFLVCIITIPIAYINFRPEELKYFGLTITSIILFISNILFFNTTSYFNDIANHSPLLHTWSLSVEEQFYLIFPLLVFIFSKKNSMKLFVIFIVFISFSSLIWSEYSASNFKDNYFFLLSNRIFEIGIGVLCAYITFYFRIKHKRFILDNIILCDFIAFLGLLAISISFFVFDDFSNMPGFLSLVPTLGTAFFILTNRKSSIISSIMSFKIGSGLGKISYSLYLWHFPVLIFLPNIKNSGYIYAIIPLLIILSFLSWKFIELPIRYNKRISDKKICLALFLSGAIIFLVGILFISTDGLKKHYLTKLNLNELQLDQAIQDTKKLKDNIPTDPCKFRDSNFTKVFMKKFHTCLKKHKSFIFVLGDSHATDLFNVIANESSYPFVVGMSAGGCRPHTPIKKCHYQNSINFVHYFKKNIKSIFYTQKGSYFLDNYQNLPVNINFIKKTKAYIDLLITVEYPIIWMGPNIEPNIPFNKNIQNLLLDDKKMLLLMNKNIFNVDSNIKSILSSSPIIYFSKVKLMNFKLKNDFYVDGKFTYSDNDHWSAFGEVYFGKKIFNNYKINKYIN